MRSLRAALVCLLASAPAQAQTLSGQWCGVAEQTGPGDHRSEWPAIVQLKGPTGYTEYPSLKCGGTLTFERMDGNLHMYRERIDYGRGLCLDGGLLGVEPLGSSIRFEWSGSDARATGVLHAPCAQQSPHANHAPNRTVIRVGAK